MSDQPTPPFPELRALEEQRSLPRLSDLLGNAGGLPSLDPPPPPAGAPGDQPILEVPRLPDPVTATGKAPQDPISPPLHELPLADHEESIQETLAALMEEGSDPPAGEPAPEETPAAEASPSSNRPDPPAGPETPPSQDSPSPDEELADAFQPIIEASLGKALASTEAGLQAFLEPMLRSTVRRAIAEQMENSRQFKRIGAFDRLGLRLLALVTGRSYEDIIFTRTRRYQVEEAYLLQRGNRTLISYASHDPVRHVSPRRVQATVRHLASRIQSSDGTLESSFDLPERRLALVREGEYSVLVAILRGRSNALVRADLDYVLHQVEDRFGTRLEAMSDAFLTVLQPLLEGCLLIQSPAPPH